MSYSEKLIRGISSKEFIDDEGRATIALFQFDAGKREDNNDELSVTWYDNQEALSIVINQKKQGKDEYQFKVGLAILRRSWLDETINRPNCKNALSYERRPIEGENPYHGNILRKTNLSPSVKNMLAATIAHCVEDIQYR